METAHYQIEPFIPDFAAFAHSRGRRVLEIGVGGGVDFLQWSQNGADASGVDLIQAGIDLATKRLARNRFAAHAPRVQRSDAESLPFADQTFDVVYSWGVLHHTPDTRRAFAEAFRVLRPGGEIRAMICHPPSWTALIMYLLHGVAKFRIFYSPRRAVFDHLESSGTKVYTDAQATALLAGVGFAGIELNSILSHGDLLTLQLSGRYHSRLHRFLFAIHPRWFVRLCGDRFGMNLLIKARKPLYCQ